MSIKYIYIVIFTLMNQQDIRKRSLKLIELGRNKALKTDVIVK